MYHYVLYTEMYMHYSTCCFFCRLFPRLAMWILNRTTSTIKCNHWVAWCCGSLWDHEPEDEGTLEPAGSCCEFTSCRNLEDLKAGKDFNRTCPPSIFLASKGRRTTRTNRNGPSFCWFPVPCFQFNSTNFLLHIPSFTVKCTTFFLLNPPRCKHSLATFHQPIMLFLRWVKGGRHQVEVRNQAVNLFERIWPLDEGKSPGFLVWFSLSQWFQWQTYGQCSAVAAPILVQCFFLL